jgi:uncharacterized membrane protein
MKTVLRTLWLMATGAGIMALWILTLQTYAGKLSLFLIWASLFVILGGLAVYTVKFNKPRKKALPVRRNVAKNRKAAKANFKVVGR